jgi:Holliday junction resolvase RusA-like endonuclease
MTLISASDAAALKARMGERAVQFTIHGKPQSKGSKQAFVAGGRAHLRDSNKHAAGWQAAVAETAGRARSGGDLLDGPLQISATFVFARPKSHFRTGKHAGELRPDAPKYHAQKPDADKLLRTLGDGLTGALVRDDCILARLSVWKLWGQADETTVQIEPIPE